MTPAHSKCSNCGTTLSSNVKFCGNCGTPASRSGDFSDKDIMDFVEADIEMHEPMGVDDLDREIRKMETDLEAAIGGTKDAAIDDIPDDVAAEPRPSASKRIAEEDKAPDQTIRKTVVTRTASKEVCISRPQLDAFVVSALEVMPCECLGMLFGHLSEAQISLSHLHPMQNVIFRDPVSVQQSVFSRRRILQIQESLGETEYVGSFHSHPYFLPEDIGEKMQDGLGLSDADIRCQLNFEDSEMELLLGYFPWEPWDLKTRETPWTPISWELKDSAGIPRDTQVISRNMAMNVKPNHLAVDFDEALLKIDETMLDLKKKFRDKDDTSASGEEDQAYAEAVGYFNKRRQRLNREKTYLEKIEKITGFRIIVAAHVKMGNGLAPCPLLLDDS